jgi:hypothetical protein
MMLCDFANESIFPRLVFLTFREMLTIGSKIIPSRLFVGTGPLK